MPHRNRVLVIDDKIEDGEAIVRRLWKLQVPTYFLHYDPELIIELNHEKRFEGIRIIFQDIALVSPDFPGHDDYSAALSGINRILSDDNGPWLLVAWSTWADDPENGDKYAKELFEYLYARLDVGKKPYHYVVIDKQPYVVSEHGELKAETDLSSTEKLGLEQSVTKALNETKTLDSLNLWETEVRCSASKIVNDLWRMVSGGNLEEKDSALGAILFQLAKAQVGSSLSKREDISTSLYQMLSSLLYDKTNRIKSNEIVLKEGVSVNLDKVYINTILHFDSDLNNLGGPGSLYEWPEVDTDLFGNLSIPEGKKIEFICDAFNVQTDKRSSIEGNSEFLEKVKIIIMDITPACDHANNKAFWRRFIVGLKIDSEYKRTFCDRKGKYNGDFLKSTPDLAYENQNFIILFNSKLILSINEIDSKERGNSSTIVDPVSNLEFIGRLREQIVQEMIHWSGSMASRPGIVALY